VKSRKALVASFLVLTGLLVHGNSAHAHHSFAAEFDESKPITLAGVVTKIEWTNPHVYFYIDVKDAGGNVVNWGFEGGNPGQLTRSGWSRTSLKIGDQVTVEGFAAKDGAHLVGTRRVTLADGGRVLGGAGAPGGDSPAE
jgi:Family of unknown function (DUF6152)